MARFFLSRGQQSKLKLWASLVAQTCFTPVGGSFVKSALWLAIGVCLGFVVADQVNRTVTGRLFFEDLNLAARQFSDSVRAGYGAHDAETRTDLPA